MIELPSKKQIASVEIHTQNTFTPLCPNELPVPEGDKIVTALNEQAKLTHYRIGSKEAHHPKAQWIARSPDEQLSPVEGENVDVKWLPHSIVGTLGFELIQGLPKITDYDYFVWEGIELDMHPYGICYHDLKETLSTGVIEFLKYHGVTTVIAGGLATDFCVKVSVLQLVNAGFKVIVNLAACRGLAQDSTKQAIDHMQANGAQLIEDLEQLKTH